MKSIRRKRIALELLGPPILGGAAVTLWAWGSLAARSLHRGEALWTVAGQLREIPVMWLIYGLFAFPMIGVQAAVYTAVMEWRFSRGLAPDSWWSVTLSTFLGCLSGLPLALGYGYERKETWYLFNTVGPTVGFVLGWLSRRLSTARKDSVGQ